MLVGNDAQIATVEAEIKAGHTEFVMDIDSHDCTRPYPACRLPTDEGIAEPTRSPHVHIRVFVEPADMADEQDVDPTDACA